MNQSTRSVPRRRRTAVALATTGLLVGAGAAAGLSAGVGNASSHREAPLTAADPQIDTTDVYGFVSPDKPDSVTLIANWTPFEEPTGGPNFYPWAADAHYDINIDNTGSATPDITYRWTFHNQDNRGTDTFLYNNGPVNSLKDKTLLFKQTYTLQRIEHGKSTTLVSDGVAAPSNVGLASMPNYAALRNQAISTFAGGQGKSLAGQAADPFFLDLRVFDLLYGANLKEAGHNTLAGYNVNTIALQVPKKDLVLKGDTTRNPVIGIWSTTERQTLKLSAGKATPSGPFVQVSRLGNPLVNEVVVPAALKDAFNALPPAKDHTIPAVVARVTNPEVPQLVEKIYGIKAPAAPRNDLKEIFLTGVCKACGPVQADLNSQMLNKDVNAKKFVPAEELRLNTAVAPTASPNRLGVLAKDLAGYPNGRRLNDDVVDIELQALEGAVQTGSIVMPLAAGDGVNTPASAIGHAFPYVALPNTGSVNQAGQASTQSGSPQGGATTGSGASTSNNDDNNSWLPIGAGVLAVVLVGSGVLMYRRRQHVEPQQPASGWSGLSPDPITPRHRTTRERTRS
jgi:hypothetical protein